MVGCGGPTFGERLISALFFFFPHQGMELLKCSFPGILPASMLAAEIQNLSAAGPEKAGLEHSFCSAFPIHARTPKHRSGTDLLF